MKVILSCQVSEVLYVRLRWELLVPWNGFIVYNVTNVKTHVAYHEMD